MVPLLVLWSVLVPQKLWFAPTQAVLIDITPPSPITLVLADFSGKTHEPSTPAAVDTASAVDLRKLFPSLERPGTYILYAVPAGKTIAEFVGTPLVISVREDRRRGAPTGPMVLKIDPLSIATMKTDAGDVELAFYYDVAPVTVHNFLTLAREGFYDGLSFHRIVPGFVIQGGDPRGTGTGGPGYTIIAEFNERPHLPGVLSMARSGDPQEAAGAPPRPEFANSAGSQFFVCLDYAATRQLDRKYTAFGRVTKGMDVVRQIAATPLADPQTGRPENPPVIRSINVRPVTPADNPYPNLLKAE